MAGVRDFHVGRLALPTVLDPISEGLGADLSPVGESTVGTARRIKGYALTWPIHATYGDNQTVLNPTLVAERLRRQVRSLVQNADLRAVGVFVQFAFDTERNGWLAIGTADLGDVNGGITLGEWQLTIGSAYLLGTRSTHRDGYRVDLTDLRLSTSEIDLEGRVVGTGVGFAGLPSRGVVCLPVGATAIRRNERQPVVGVGSRPGSEGAVPVFTTGAYAGMTGGGVGDGDVVTFEQADANSGLGDVLVHDRRGNVGPFGVGGAYDVAPWTSALAQDTYGWDEIYGTDWPLYAPAADTPVLSNGLCRVRYDAAANPAGPGWTLGLWDAVNSRWATQGKLWAERWDGATWRQLDTLDRASLVEVTPERAVVRVDLRASADSLSAERCYLTLQRGWTGPKLEVYSAPGSNGAWSATGVGVRVGFTSAAGETEAVALSADTLAGGIGFTAGSVPGGTLATSAPVGGFTGENWLAFLRAGQPALAFAVADPGVQRDVLTVGGANTVRLRRAGSQYLGVRVGSYVAEPDQILEAEAIRNASSPTTAQVADAAAFGGQTVSDNQAAATNRTLSKNNPGLRAGRHRIFARIRIDAGTTISLRGDLGAGSTAPTVSWSNQAAYAWVDVGEVLPPAPTVGQLTPPRVGLSMWVTAGAGAGYVDQLAAVRVDESDLGAYPAGIVLGYDGVRDLGAGVLADVRQEPRRVARG